MELPLDFQEALLSLQAKAQLQGELSLGYTESDGVKVAIHDRDGPFSFWRLLMASWHHSILLDWRLFLASEPVPVLMVGAAKAPSDMDTSVISVKLSYRPILDLSTITFPNLSPICCRGPLESEAVFKTGTTR